MSNELILIISLIGIYGAVLLWYKMLGKNGLISFTVLATIAANIEASMLVNAFGMEQTLGNILFGSTFLITDILSEVYGKKEAQKAVNVGIFTSITFILITKSWFFYTPAAGDTMHPIITQAFSNTPRLMIASLVVYVIAQKFDVWAYHKFWALTERLCGDKRKYLWVRNNGSTLVSQLLNTVLFTVFAFWGTYDVKTIMSIVWSSYVIFIVTSIADTPAVYIARYISEKHVINEE